MKVEYCTHCGKLLQEYRIEIRAFLKVDRRALDWEEIPNTNIMNSEYICEECFNIFINIMQDFNKREV
jgi:hypothetical protein